MCTHSTLHTCSSGYAGNTVGDMDSLDVYYNGTFEPQNHDGVGREPPACLYSRCTEQVPYLELSSNTSLGNQDGEFAPYELPSCQLTASPGYLQAEAQQADAYHLRTDETTAHMAFPWMRTTRSQICQAPITGNTLTHYILGYSLILLQYDAPTVKWHCALTGHIIRNISTLHTGSFMQLSILVADCNCDMVVGVRFAGLCKCPGILFIGSTKNRTKN